MSDDIQSKLRAGVDAAKRGDRTTARRLLEEVISVDENNELAWIWLASSVNTAAERRTCLERVLQINPNNTRAKEALERLGGATAPRTDSEQARVRETINRVRQVQDTRTLAPRDTAIGGGGNFPLTSVLIGGGLLLAVVVLGFIGVNLINQVNRAAIPTATQVVVAPPTETETPVDTPTITPTRTPLDRNQITRVFAPTLPPDFTPTFTPIPSQTPIPSATPLGLDVFGMIYTSLNGGAEQPDSYIIQADGSNEGLMFDNLRDPAISPDGSRITFIRNVNIDGSVAPEVYIAELNNENSAQPLTGLRAADTQSPSFSPDGTQIVFSSSANSASEEIWIMNVDGTNMRKLTDNATIDREPAFSPVENVIAYTSDLDSPELTEIYLMRLGEGDPTIERLTNASGNSYSPSWSQNGVYLAFASDRTGGSDIYRMEAARSGSEILMTLDGRDIENRRPSISADGRWVAYTSNLDGEGFQTYITDGFVVTRLTNNGRDDLDVIFSPLPPDIFGTQ